MKLELLQEGINFKCTGCGQCCTGEPGYVFLSDEDIENLATKLSISKDLFLQKYTRYVEGRISLLEDPKNYDCIFLKNQKHCTVYEARPKQCKTFPWWPGNFENEEEFEETKNRCEGFFQDDAPCISYEEIMKAMDDE